MGVPAFVRALRCGSFHALRERKLACRAVARGSVPAFARALRRGSFHALRERKLVGGARIELATPSMSRKCSPTELTARPDRAM